MENINQHSGQQSFNKTPNPCDALTVILSEQCTGILVRIYVKAKSIVLAFNVHIPQFHNSLSVSFQNNVLQISVLKAAFKLSNKLLGLFTEKCRKPFGLNLCWLVRLPLLISEMNVLNVAFWMVVDLYFLDFTGELVMVPFVGGITFFPMLLQSRITVFQCERLVIFLVLSILLSLIHEDLLFLPIIGQTGMVVWILLLHDGSY